MQGACALSSTSQPLPLDSYNILTKLRVQHTCRWDIAMEYLPEDDGEEPEEEEEEEGGPSGEGAAAAGGGGEA